MHSEEFPSGTESLSRLASSAQAEGRARSVRREHGQPGNRVNTVFQAEILPCIGRVRARSVGLERNAEIRATLAICCRKMRITKTGCTSEAGTFRNE